jgi:transcriptional regulator with XRE-family HTH domain
MPPRRHPEPYRFPRPPLSWQLKRLGLTTIWLAEAVGVSKVYVRRIARGVEPGSDELRARIAEAVGLPEDELFGEVTVTVTPVRARAAS